MLPKGFQHLAGYFERPAQTALLMAIRSVLAQAPLYTPCMPRTGKAMSVRMSNCGTLGWLTDKDGGYRYQKVYPETGQAWPPIPTVLMDLWRDVVPQAPPPEACLINYYGAGTRLGSHVDSDEQDRSVPVVSVSLGDEGVFHVGGSKRTDPKTRMPLRSGDVVVLGGAARLAYHGIDRIVPGSSDLIAEGGRFNLTLRRVTLMRAAA